MENYPLYGEAHAALSPNCEERNTRKMYLSFLTTPCPHCGGISASLHRKHKRKSKSFQTYFSCKMGCILIESSEILYSRASWCSAYRDSCRHITCFMGCGIHDSQGKTSISLKLCSLNSVFALTVHPLQWLFNKRGTYWGSFAGINTKVVINFHFKGAIHREKSTFFPLTW